MPDIEEIFPICEGESVVESRAFYEVMQDYRHARISADNVYEVSEKFNAVKAFILRNYDPKN